MAGDGGAQGLAAAWVAIAEMGGVWLREMVAEQAAELAEQQRIRMGAAEGEGLAAGGRRQGGSGGRKGRAAWKLGGDEGAGAGAGFGEAIAQQVLIGGDDGIAADAELSGEGTAGRQAQPGRKAAAENGGAQGGVDAAGLAVASFRRQGDVQRDVECGGGGAQGF
ncbi:hypothetical protein HMPREF9946_00728 [Acetobacteraceae bacterium AT-5844]|nr:hypothetical protein HMPREF9946_00728 [Acetobacteraceae bacterium AT-5844]